MADVVNTTQQRALQRGDMPKKRKNKVTRGRAPAIIILAQRGHED